MSSETSPTDIDVIDRIALKGIQLGLDRGRLLGQQDLLLIQLKRKLGNLRLRLVLKVISLPVERLEILGADLLGFDSTEDLEQWLDL